EQMEIVWNTSADPPLRQDYIIRDGIRYVRPYYFEFIAHAKNRWAGKTIVDLFADEFFGRNREYYVDAVKSGRIQVSGRIVPISYVIRSSEKISHFVHRHEPPVMATDVKILCMEPDVVTVCKPASVPVHPCGQYRKNTVVGILQAEHDVFPLFPIHRLDRLVSGLLILARSASKADVFRQQIESGEVKKQYIAKVVGVFPPNEVLSYVNVCHDAREGKCSVEKRSAPKGKPAFTKFTRIDTDGAHSIVLCEPITGRTHQIRVHLKHLGHPIANDALYLSEHVPRRSAVRSSSSTESRYPLEPNEGDVVDFDIDPTCTNCPDLAPVGYGGDEDGLWLHCVKYSGPDWSYECPYPHWAS
ncbi:hypothetical protein M569_01799, partial [Genlisea aurea]